MSPPSITLMSRRSSFCLTENPPAATQVHGLLCYRPLARGRAVGMVPREPFPDLRAQRKLRSSLDTCGPRSPCPSCWAHSPASISFIFFAASWTQGLSVGGQRELSRVLGDSTCLLHPTPFSSPKESANGSDANDKEIEPCTAVLTSCILQIPAIRP